MILLFLKVFHLDVQCSMLCHQLLCRHQQSPFFLFFLMNPEFYSRKIGTLLILFKPFYLLEGT
jgi:hypothetical protein